MDWLSDLWFRLWIAIANAAWTHGGKATERGNSLLAERLLSLSLRLFRALGQNITNRELTISSVLLSMGDALIEQGKLENARAVLIEALAIRRRLALAASDSRIAKEDIAIALERAADLAFHERGDLDEAREMYPECLDLWTHLKENAPSAERPRHAVAIVKGKFGALLHHLKQFDEAKQILEQSLDACTELTADHPESEIYERDLAHCLARLGNLLLDQSQLARAKELLENSLYIRQRLAAGYPTVLNRQLDLAIGLGLLGTVLAMEDSSYGAKMRLKESLDKLTQICSRAPASASAQRHLWMAMWRLAMYFPDDPVRWSDVVSLLDHMRRRGTLVPGDARYLDDARAYAAGTTLPARVRKNPLDLIQPTVGGSVMSS